MFLLSLLNGFKRAYLESSNSIAPLALSLTLSDPSALVDIKALVQRLYSNIQMISFSPFRVGDSIKLQGAEGIVERIGIRYVVLRKKKGKGRIFVPHSVIYNGIVEVE